MSTTSPASQEQSPSKPAALALPIPYREFISLMALLMSMTAMSIDIMLPALPEIGATLSVSNASDLPLIVSIFMLGAAIGQLIWGPLADRFGRRRPLLAGLVLYAAATVVVVASQGFGQLLAARFIQGIGGSVGRTIVTTIVRDLFAGRQMARVMSTVMMVFIMVPILAPSVGQAVILVGTWRWIFMVLLSASLISITWASVRLPETQVALAPGERRPSMREALGLVMGSRVTLGYGVASGFTFGHLVAYIASSQQVFGQGYALGKLFPFAFGSVACAIALASFTNSRLVQRLGMRRLSHSALIGLLGLSSVLALSSAGIPLPFWVALGGMAICFFLYGLIQSNFNAIAMQPMGHAAGMAASLIGSYSTAAGALMGTLIARQYDGTILPMFAGFAILSACALITIVAVEGRDGLFRGE